MNNHIEKVPEPHDAIGAIAKLSPRESAIKLEDNLNVKLAGVDRLLKGNLPKQDQEIAKAAKDTIRQRQELARQIVLTA